jgi:hypothetical protein
MKKTFRYLIILSALLLPSSANAAKQCIMCEPGKYADETTGGACNDCPAGSYCIQGIKFACPTTTYNGKTSQTDGSACKDCNSPNAATTDRTRCCKASGNSCLSGNLSGWGGAIESGCFTSSEAQGYNNPTGGDSCHCRGRIASNTVSTWGAIGNGNDKCSSNCANWCAKYVSSWGLRAAW